MIGDGNCSAVADKDQKDDNPAGNAVVEESFVADEGYELENGEETSGQDGGEVDYEADLVAIIVCIPVALPGRCSSSTRFAEDTLSTVRSLIWVAMGENDLPQRSRYSRRARMKPNSAPSKMNPSRSLAGISLEYGPTYIRWRYSPWRSRSGCISCA